MPQRLSGLQVRASRLLEDERPRAVSAGVRRMAAEPAFRRMFALVLTSLALSLLATALFFWIRRSMHFVGEEFVLDTTKSPAEPFVGAEEVAAAEESSYEAELELIGSPAD